MENICRFATIKDLFLALNREERLIQAMFQNRKKLSFSYEIAMELASKGSESLAMLSRYGVIRICGDSVELEDTYLKFLEEVLQVNETINIASVKEYIDSLNEEIEYYLSETSPNRKLTYVKNVKRILRNIAYDTYRNVIDLKRNIDNTYKNEPSFAVKKKKLVNLDEKRKGVSSLIKECEKLIDERQATFFLVAMDDELKKIVLDLKYRFVESYHNLFELDKQIINYLNLIDYQDRLFQKVQKLKYLRDQLLLDTNTDIQAKTRKGTPVWMEPRPQYALKASLSALRNSDEGYWVLQDVIRKLKGRLPHKRSDVEPLTEEELRQEARVVKVLDIRQVKNAFLASGDHLFHFVMNYSAYNIPMDEEAKLVLFCQIATQFLDELTIRPDFGQYKQWCYPIIHPKSY